MMRIPERDGFNQIWAAIRALQANEQKRRGSSAFIDNAPISTAVGQLGTSSSNVTETLQEILDQLVAIGEQLTEQADLITDLTTRVEALETP